eukprot:1769547-Rhodomonas_salina.1
MSGITSKIFCNAVCGPDAWGAWAQAREEESEQERRDKTAKEREAEAMKEETSELQRKEAEGGDPLGVEQWPSAAS